MQNCTPAPRHIPVAIVDSRTHFHLAVVCGSLAVVTLFAGLASVLLYRWYQRARRGYCSRHVKTMFGHGKEAPSNFEAEETVALLTLGLRNLYLPLPAARSLGRYPGVKYGTAW